MTTSSSTREQRDPRAIAALITLALHAWLGLGLYLAGELIDRNDPGPVPIEVEIIEPPPKPKPRIEPPRIEPPKVEPEKLPEPPREPPKRVAVKQPAARPVAEPKVEPAPGPDTNQDTPAPVVTLPDIGPGGIGGVPVAVGRPTTRKVGTGGTGTNTGGGGADDAKGTEPVPVSIAAIKRRARPLNPDLDTSKLYPAEARRLGIEGQIKVALVVDESGKVVKRRLITRLGHGLDELALQLAERLSFEPAIDTNDRPVTDKVVWTFTFVLPE